jgi:hypothetical protein
MLGKDDKNAAMGAQQVVHEQLWLAAVVLPVVLLLSAMESYASPVPAVGTYPAFAQLSYPHACARHQTYTCNRTPLSRLKYFAAAAVCCRLVVR